MDNMYTMILKVNIWENADKTERRIYVETFRGEYIKMRGEDVAQFHGGCLYRTGNHWNPKGSKDGDLTETEWHMACNMSKPNTFVRYYHPRYEDILAANPSYRPFDEAKAEATALAARQAERANRDPRLDTALDVAGYAPINSFITVTKKDGSETVMIVLDVYEYTEEYEQSSSDRRQSGWYMRCGEPLEAEKQTPEYVAIAQQLAKLQATHDKTQAQLNALAVQQFGVREKHTAEYWQQQRAERSKLPQEQQDLPDDELFNDLFKGDAE